MYKTYFTTLVAFLSMQEIRILIVQISSEIQQGDIDSVVNKEMSLKLRLTTGFA